MKSKPKTWLSGLPKGAEKQSWGLGGGSVGRSEAAGVGSASEGESLATLGSSMVRGDTSLCPQTTGNTLWREQVQGRWDNSGQTPQLRRQGLQGAGALPGLERGRKPHVPSASPGTRPGAPHSGAMPSSARRAPPAPCRFPRAQPVHTRPFLPRFRPGAQSPHLRVSGELAAPVLAMMGRVPLGHPMRPRHYGVSLGSGARSGQLLLSPTSAQA